MKIRHWSGYGTVSAVKINDGTKLHIRVTGDHERGLWIDLQDTYLLYQWLVKRFDRSAPPYEAWMRSVPLIDADEGWCKAPDGSIVDKVDYYFMY